MKLNIDELSVELAEEIAFENIEKTLPPKLLYRWRKWMRTFRRTSPQAVDTAKFEQLVQEKFSEIANIKELKKNEAQASFYDNGVVKMDFGTDVDPKVKEAAMRWAKKKGLKAMEANLQKSANEPVSITFAASQTNLDGHCVKRLKWAF